MLKTKQVQKPLIQKRSNDQMVRENKSKSLDFDPRTSKFEMTEENDLSEFPHRRSFAYIILRGVERAEGGRRARWNNIDTSPFIHGITLPNEIFYA